MPIKQFKVLCVVGARPNFMKIAPIISALEAVPEIDPVLIHTGQHYDHAMKELLFVQLGIPVPAVDLEVRGGSHADQTAKIMQRFEPVLIEQNPAAILVVGDVNSTIACALVAVKLHIPVIHVEAGLRSGDLKMPEEVNRLLTDRISQLLFTTEKLGNDNLLREGVDARKIRFVGNVMIDTLMRNIRLAPTLYETLDNCNLNDCVERIKLSGGKFAFLTLHRPSNVDDPDTLGELLEAINTISAEMPVIFAVHPRTKSNVEKFGFGDKLTKTGNVFTTEPLGYLDAIALMSNATVVLTDSGGIQEETTALGVPCLTIRDNTERWITVEQGTNTITGSDAKKLLQEFNKVLNGEGKAGRKPELWDGHAAERIAQELSEWFKSGQHLMFN